MEQLLLPIDDLIGELTERTLQKRDPWDKSKGRSWSEKIAYKLDGSLMYFWYASKGQQRLTRTKKASPSAR